MMNYDQVCRHDSEIFDSTFEATFRLFLPLKPSKSKRHLLHLGLSIILVNNKRKVGQCPWLVSQTPAGRNYQQATHHPERHCIAFFSDHPVCLTWVYYEPPDVKSKEELWCLYTTWICVLQRSSALCAEIQSLVVWPLFWHISWSTLLTMERKHMHTHTHSPARLTRGTRSSDYTQREATLFPFPLRYSEVKV